MPAGPTIIKIWEPEFYGSSYWAPDVDATYVFSVGNRLCLAYNEIVNTTMPTIAGKYQTYSFLTDTPGGSQISTISLIDSTPPEFINIDFDLDGFFLSFNFWKQGSQYHLVSLRSNQILDIEPRLYIQNSKWEADSAEAIININNGFILSGRFIYNGTFYDCDFIDHYSNIADTFGVIQGGITTIIPTDQTGVLVPVILEQNTSPYDTNHLYFWDIQSTTPNTIVIEDLTLLTYGELKLVRLYTSSTSYTVVFDMVAIPQVEGGYIAAFCIAPDPFLIKIDNQIIELAYYMDYDNSDLSAKVYKTSDNKLFIASGQVAVMFAPLPYLAIWADETYQGKTIDILTKAKVVNGFPIDVPEGTTYVGLDENNIINEQTISTDTTILKTAWYKTKLDQFTSAPWITSFGVKSALNNKFVNSQDVEFNSVNSGNNIFWLKTDNPEDIYWKYETATK